LRTASPQLPLCVAHLAPRRRLGSDQQHAEFAQQGLLLFRRRLPPTAATASRVIFSKSTFRSTLSSTSFCNRAESPALDLFVALMAFSTSLETRKHQLLRSLRGSSGCA